MASWLAGWLKVGNAVTACQVELLRAFPSPSPSNSQCAGQCVTIGPHTSCTEPQ